MVITQAMTINEKEFCEQMSVWSLFFRVSMAAEKGTP
jgi:hypothetical protein